MSKNELKKLIEESLSTHQIAERMGCGQTTIRYWLKKFGLKTQHKRYNRKRDYCCTDCGEKNKDKFLKLKKNGEATFHHSLCSKCHNHRTIERQRAYKVKAIAYKGGKCTICGYTGCPGAFDFHHPDKDKKDWQKIRNTSFENMKRLLDKTILVCSRCHREIHWNQHEN